MVLRLKSLRNLSVRGNFLRNKWKKVFVTFVLMLLMKLTYNRSTLQHFHIQLVELNIVLFDELWHNISFISFGSCLMIFIAYLDEVWI